MHVILLYMCMQKKGYVHPLGAHKTGFALKMEKTVKWKKNTTTFIDLEDAW